MQEQLTNNPPDQTVITQGVIAELRAWLEANPVIVDLAGAKHGAELHKRAKIAFDELEAERDGKVRPLNTQVKAINDAYTQVKSPLNRVRDELAARLEAYRRAEEARRQEEALAAMLKAEEARKAALEAEQRERAAIEEANAGVVNAGVVDAQADADAAFEQFQQADRAAKIAEKDSTVRIGTDFGRAVSARTTYTFVVEDAFAALKVMGVSEKVKDAIASAAKAWFVVKGQPPLGVRRIADRAIR